MDAARRSLLGRRRLRRVRRPATAGAAAADLPHRSQLRPRRRLSDEGRRTDRRSHAARLRGARERRAAADRAVRTRRHPREPAPGSPRRAEDRARVARDGGQPPRAPLRRLSRHVSRGRRRVAQHPQTARGRARSAHRPGRSRCGNDAADAGIGDRVRAQDDDDRRLSGAPLGLGRPRSHDGARSRRRGLWRLLSQRASRFGVHGSERHRGGDDRPAAREDHDRRDSGSRSLPAWAA